MERALDLCEEENALEIYKVDILSVMLAFKRIWRQLETSVIRNCWRHTGLTSHPTEEIVPNITAEEQDLKRSVEQLVPRSTRVDVRVLLNPVGEDACTEVVIENDMIGQITEVTEEPGENNDVKDDDEHKDVVPLPPIQRQLRAVAICKRLWDAFSMTDVIHGSLKPLQKAVRSEHAYGA